MAGTGSPPLHSVAVTFVLVVPYVLPMAFQRKTESPIDAGYPAGWPVENVPVSIAVEIGGARDTCWNFFGDELPTMEMALFPWNTFPTKVTVRGVRVPALPPSCTQKPEPGCILG